MLCAWSRTIAIMCCFCTCNDVSDMEIYVTKQFIKVTAAAPDGNVFERVGTSVEGVNEPAT